MRTYVICNQCDWHLDVISGFDESMVCPNCKANDWNHNVPEVEKKELRKKVKLIERTTEEKKPYRKIYSGEELYRKTNQWHHIERVFDSENDIYTEKIIDIETGEVIREFSEPKSEHKGHGDDKKNNLDVND